MEDVDVDVSAQAPASTSAAAGASFSISLGSTQLPQDTLVINLAVGGSCATCQVHEASSSALDLSLLADAIVERLRRSSSTKLPPSDHQSLPTKAAPVGKKVRTKTGCITCRTRRTKCDEGKPVCSSCSRDPNRVCRYSVLLSLPPPHARVAAAPRALVRGAVLTEPGDQGLRGAAPWPGLTPQGPVQDMLHTSAENPAPASWGRDVDVLAALLPPARSRELLHHVATRTFTFNISLCVSPKTHGFTPGRLRAAGLFNRACSFIFTYRRRHGSPQRNSRPGCWSFIISAQGRRYGRQDIVTGAPYERRRRDFLAGAERWGFPCGGPGRSGLRGGARPGERGYFDVQRLHHCRFRLYSAIRKSCGGAIRHNGGPATLLMLSSGHHYGTELDYRRLLVYLSGTDIFCSMTSGESPTILLPSELLWFEQQSDCSSAIEGVFGVSQGMLLAAAEVCHLVSDFETQGATPDLQETAASVFVGLDETWLPTIIATPNGLRIQIGDLMFRHYLIASLLLRVFGHTASHPRILQSVAAIKELLIEALSLTGLMTGFLLPLVFASCHSDALSRSTFRVVLDTMKDIIGCWDLEAAERIILESWRRRDAGDENWFPQDVVQSDPTLRVIIVS